MFLEIQLSVIKSGCHPDSWWQSEERRIKKPADVSCVGTDHTTGARGNLSCHKVGSPLASNHCHHPDYLVARQTITNGDQNNLS